MTTLNLKTIPQGFEESTAPELFKFETIGQELEGYFRSIARVEIPEKIDGKATGKKVSRLEITLESEKGGQLKILATYDLQQKMGRQHVGKWVWLRYAGEDESIQTQGNKMKVFQVAFNPKKRLAAKDLEITDDDLGF